MSYKILGNDVNRVDAVAKEQEKLNIRMIL